jgi:predicted house-cleaning NTP pyrophosphatase (Maf/HAM1 superfamily)
VTEIVLASASPARLAVLRAAVLRRLLAALGFGVTELWA